MPTPPATPEPPDFEALRRAVVETFLDQAAARSDRLTLAELCARLGVDEQAVRARATAIAVEHRDDQPEPPASNPFVAPSEHFTSIGGVELDIADRTPARDIDL